jgi:hypothetical protein
VVGDDDAGVPAGERPRPDGAVGADRHRGRRVGRGGDAVDAPLVAGERAASVEVGQRPAADGRVEAGGQHGPVRDRDVEDVLGVGVDRQGVGSHTVDTTRVTVTPPAVGTGKD